jgi:hypothetical protein
MSARNEIRGMIGGVFLVFAMHLLVGFILGTFLFFIRYLISYLSATLSLQIVMLVVHALEGVGIAQLLYVIPLVIWFRQRRQWGLMKGVIIGAVITALLNGGCWLIYT